MKTRLMLVPSTHWDREWYKPHAEFGVHLTELFDTVLTKHTAHDIFCMRQ